MKYEIYTPMQKKMYTYIYSFKKMDFISRFRLIVVTKGHVL